MIRVSSIIAYGNLCIRGAYTLPLFVRPPHHLRFSTSYTLASSPPLQIEDHSKPVLNNIRPLLIVPRKDSEYLPVLAKSLKVPFLMLKLVPQNDTVIYNRKDFSKSLVEDTIPRSIERRLNMASLLNKQRETRESNSCSNNI